MANEEPKGPPRGSMMSGSALEEKIRAQRAAQAIESAKEEAAETPPEPETDPIAAELTKKLPTTVRSTIHQEVTFDAFKHIYRDVWQQVIDKSHLMVSRVIFETTLFGQPLVVRTISMGEDKALARYRAEGQNIGDQASDRLAGFTEYQARQIVAQLVRLGETEFPECSPAKVSREEWEKATEPTYEMIMGMDSEFTSIIVGLIDDVAFAKRLALLENLGNP